MKFFFAMFLFFTTLICFSQKTISKEFIIADSMFKIGNYDKARELYLNLMGNKLDDSLKAEIFLRYGSMQPSYNKIDSGIFYLKNALVIYELQKNNIKIGRCLQNIGDFYSLKKNYTEAENYLKKSLTFAIQKNDSIKNYISLLVLHLRKKDFDNAYSIINTQLNKYPPDAVAYQKYYMEEGIGLYLHNKKDYETAIQHFKIACNASPDESFKIVILNNIADSYRELKNYTSAFMYQDSAAGIEKNIGWAENQGQYDNYAKLYEETGDYKRALYYSKLGRNLSDSFFDIEKNNALLDAEAKYQNEKTKAEKVLVEKDNSIKQRNLVFSFIALGLLALLAFVALRSARNRQKANEILASQKLEVQQLADELSAANETKARLFSTIGHDLRSPISSLYAQLKLQELKGNTTNTAMSQQTTNLLDTLEELLVWSKSQMEGFVLQQVKINMYSLFEELKDFYNASAQVKNIFIVNETNENIIVRTDENILKTILRNLISNAIAHTPSEKNIVLHAKLDGGKFFIAVKNTCSKDAYQKLQLTFDTAHVKSNAHGFGIVLIKEFAQKINATVQLSYDGENAIVGFVID